MTRIFAILLLAVTLVTGTKAQSFSWLDGEETGYEMNPAMAKYAVSVAEDNTAWFGGMKLKKTSYYDMMGDLFLIHYDTEGNRMSEYLITGTSVIKSMENDPQGNLYIAGDLIYEDAVFWDGTILEWNGNSINAFLARINGQGEVDWAVNLNDALGLYSPVSDMVFRNGQLFVAHASWMASLVSVADGSGNLQPVITESDVGIISGLDMDSEGNIYVTGSCAGTNNSFNGVNFASPFTYDKHLVKYNASYEPQWIRFSEDVTCIFPRVKVDLEDNVYWSGQLFNACYFDTIYLHGPDWVNDFFLVKMNPQGDALWAREVPQGLTGDASVAETDFLRILPDNSIALLGKTRGTVDWGNGVVTHMGVGIQGVLLLNFDPQGSAQWARTNRGEGYATSQYLDLDDEGNLYFTGVGHDTLWFGDLWLYRETFYYPYIVKTETDIATSTETIPPVSSATLFPNPASERLNISIPAKNIRSIELIDLSGKVISIKNKDALDISKLSPGMYIIKIIGHDSSVYTGRFIKY